MIGPILTLLGHVIVAAIAVAGAFLLGLGVVLMRRGAREVDRRR
jgi:hypothetical protein